MDYTAHAILEARILEWVTFPFSRESSQPRDQTQVSHIEDSLSAEPLGKPKLQVIVGIHNGLPQGGNLSPPPVKDCKQVKLTEPPA